MHICMHQKASISSLFLLLTTNLLISAKIHFFVQFSEFQTFLTFWGKMILKRGGNKNYFSKKIHTPEKQCLNPLPRRIRQFFGATNKNLRSADLRIYD